MKLEFKKILNLPKTFCFEKENLSFVGSLKKVKNNLVEIDGFIKADVILTCDRCGKEYQEKFDSEVKIFASEGLFSGDLDEIIYEFHEGYIDLSEIVYSEIESLKSDYHYCDECIEKQEICYEV
ncbi:MAG: hypothetical protein HXX81_03385 [Campylobacterales bacterium]|nr:hypothetical protein [Campylobacterales bacterium]